MAYTRNQHMLSQWVLRNFRSDDTALSPKGKQRVWCHTVYPSHTGDNVLYEQPLPISSVAVAKNLFRLIDAKTGEAFDIEEELGAYERLTSSVVNDIIHEHNFSKLRLAKPAYFPFETLTSFAVMQLLLNLHNPQNKNPYKKDLLDHFHRDIEMHLGEYIKSIQSLPSTQPALMNDSFYQKLLRVANASSPKEDKCRAIFTLFSLLAILNKPTPYDMINVFRNKIFSRTSVIEIIHTGHAFDSTDPRPVFAIAPNIFCLCAEQNRIYLPLSHNFTLCFITGTPLTFRPRIDVFSPRPELLKCCDDSQLNFYKVSFDYIDNVMSTIDMYNVGNSSTFYSAYQLSDVEAYLDLQEKDRQFYYTSAAPVRWQPQQPDSL